MSAEDLALLRQYDFSGGPNYTNSPFALEQNELAQTDNMYWEGGLKAVPGASRVVSTQITAGPRITGLTRYEKKTGTKYLVAATSNGRIERRTTGNWTNLTTGLATTATTVWDWCVFNDTLIGCNGAVVKKWDGTTFAALGGSPPAFKYIIPHGDFLIGTGHSGSIARYNDVYSTTSHNTWPSGNTLNIGPDDGEVPTGLARWGDITLIFKDHSIHALAGLTPSAFSIYPTPAGLGTNAPLSICWTDAGIFFWSEGGPALFDGSRVNLLVKRMKTLLDTVDWTAAGQAQICSTFDPIRRLVFVSYRRSGQSTADRTLLIDLKTWSGDDVVFWPILAGHTAMCQHEDSNGRLRPHFGTPDGYVLQWDSGTTWNGAVLVPRARSRIFHLGRPDQTTGIRSYDVWTQAQSAGTVTMRYAVDGATSFSTHAATHSMVETGKDVAFTRLASTDGSGHIVPGKLLQLEVTASGNTSVNLYGWEIGVEQYGRR